MLRLVLLGVQPLWSLDEATKWKVLQQHEVCDT
jgi:hypothetical protein